VLRKSANHAYTAAVVLFMTPNKSLDGSENPRRLAESFRVPMEPSLTMMG
jgi:hypothetical protein